MSQPTIAAEPRTRRRHRRAAFIAFVIGLIAVGAFIGAKWLTAPGDANPFVLLRNSDQRIADRGIDRIAADWKPEYTAMVLNVAPLTMHLGHRERLFDILRTKTGQSFANDQLDSWYRWLWSQPATDGNALNRLRYEFFKASPYPFGGLEIFFEHDPPLAIRADEIRWGGILPVTIQPIRSPKTVPAANATYLSDGDLVFGLRINGEARAYPRRILGHHQIVTDTVGGQPITAVYCPLCETMIPFDSRTAEGTFHNFAISGFLYRSNWLMFDRGTRSLWYTLSGAPLLGQAVASGVRLKSCPVVTTTWKEWHTANPDTQTIPLPQAADEDPIDYSEGAAYRAYFATDTLWQSVPELDPRLKNKDQVFVPRPPGDHSPVALSAAFLAAHPVYQLNLDGDKLLIVTSARGANRAYAVGERTFKPGTTPSTLRDGEDAAWTIGEEALTAPGQAPLPRVPGHRSFWFAWHAAYPDTALIK